MKKVAIFVEGPTEQYFIVKLLEEVFGVQHLSFDVVQARGGSSCPFSYAKIEARSVQNARWYFLIYECQGDSAIRSFILEQRPTLIKAGYEKIVGLRDVFPLDRADIVKLRNGLYYNLPQKDIRIDFVLSVMEIEAWFIAECSHFSRIHPTLTVAHIKNICGFDPCVDDVELINAPASVLDMIYSSAGFRYRKKKSQVSRTVAQLDYGVVYFELPQRVPSLHELVGQINSVF